MLSRMKFFLVPGLLVPATVWVMGCAAMNPHRMCEEELADAHAQLAQTAAQEKKMSAMLRQQQAEIDSLKHVSAANVRRQKEKALAEIEAQREDLERERFEVNRMRELAQARDGEW
jgi:septal ring factor EnvC (AmiA/AmiB activator)